MTGAERQSSIGNVTLQPKGLPFPELSPLFLRGDHPDSFSQLAEHPDTHCTQNLFHLPPHHPNPIHIRNARYGNAAPSRSPSPAADETTDRMPGSALLRCGPYSIEMSHKNRRASIFTRRSSCFWDVFQWVMIGGLRFGRFGI